MSLKYTNIENTVYEKVGKETMQEMERYVKQKRLILWGEDKPRYFLKRNLILCLYKDIVCIGYQRLLRTVDGLGFRINHKSLQHNTLVLRKSLHAWATVNIRLGTLKEWTDAARHVSPPDELSQVCLWMDSVDFILQGRRTVSRRSPDWSYKSNRPGQRYMFLRDGKGKVRKVWGGYSPKTFDGHWLRVQREWLEEELAGAGVIADNHFVWGTKNLHRVKFYCNLRELHSCQEDIDPDPTNYLSAKQRTLNLKIKQLRARVENTFGQMLGMFTSLSKPWAEGKQQQDYLVLVAAAVLNKKH